MILFGVPVKQRQLIYLVGDVVVALLAMLAGHVLRWGPLAMEAQFSTIVTETTGATFIFVGVHIVMLYVADAYNPSHNFREPAALLRIWLSVAVAFAVQMVLFYALPFWWWGRGVTGLSSALFAVALTGWRVGFCALRPVPPLSRRCLVVGASEAGRSIAAVIDGPDGRTRGYKVVGFIDEKVKETPSGSPVLGGDSDVLDLVERLGVQLIVVAIRGRISETLTKQLLECKRRGVIITNLATIHRSLTGKVPIQHLAETWFIFGPSLVDARRLDERVQRVIDVVFAAIGLVLSFPIVAVAAVAVRLESPGPAFFLQERLGKDEVPFTIWKLRTMRKDAEAGTGAVWSQGAGDPRVTRLGRLLRRSRLDELPQLWNVLRGDMSLVGPRPERAHFVNQLKQRIPFYGLRFVVKPGVTGWAQVMYRYGASEEDAAEKLSYELYAIQEMGPVLYLLILLRTVQTVLLRPGS